MVATAFRLRVPAVIFHRGYPAKTSQKTLGFSTLSDRLGRYIFQSSKQFTY